MSETGTIHLFVHEIDFTYPQEETGVSRWIKSTCLREGKEIDEVSIIFCSDDYLLALNQEHLQHDYYTDIITFEYTNHPISGELYISVDRVKENALELELPFIDELDRVIIHGILHLCGYSDHDEQARAHMRHLEDTYLNSRY